MNRELCGRKSSRTILSNYPSFCLEGLKKISKPRIKSGYEAEMLTSQVWRSRWWPCRKFAIFVFCVGRSLSTDLLLVRRILENMQCDKWNRKHRSVNQICGRVYSTWNVIIRCNVIFGISSYFKDSNILRCSILTLCLSFERYFPCLRTDIKHVHWNFYQLNFWKMFRLI